jgi:hypothetical protein
VTTSYPPPSRGRKNKDINYFRSRNLFRPPVPLKAFDLTGMKGIKGIKTKIQFEV